MIFILNQCSQDLQETISPASTFAVLQSLPGSRDENWESYV